MAGASDRAGAALAQSVRTTAHPSVAELADPAPGSPSGPVALEAPVTLPGVRPERRATPISDHDPTATTAESVLAESRARLEGLGNYQVWLNRQERVGEHAAVAPKTWSSASDASRPPSDSSGRTARTSGARSSTRRARTAA